MAKQSVPNSHSDDDSVVYKVLISIVIAIAAIYALVKVRQYDTVPAYYSAIRTGVVLIGWIGLAIAVLLAVAAILFKSAKPGLRYLFRYVCAIAALTALSCLLIHVFWKSAPLGCIYMWAAVAVLYCLYLLYQAEFLPVAFLTILAAGVFYLLSRDTRGTFCVVALIALIVFSVLIACGTFALAKKDGKVRFGSRKFQLFSADFSPVPLYLACALWTICALLSLAVGAAFAYYCIYAAVGGGLIAICYYTVKMM